MVKEIKIVVASGRMGRLEGYKAAFWGDGRVLFLDRGVGYLSVNTHQN